MLPEHVIDCFVTLWMQYLATDARYPSDITSDNAPGRGINNFEKTCGLEFAYTISS